MEVEVDKVTDENNGIKYNGTNGHSQATASADTTESSDETGRRSSLLGSDWGSRDSLIDQCGGRRGSLSRASLCGSSSSGINLMGLGGYNSLKKESALDGIEKKRRENISGRLKDIQSSLLKKDVVLSLPPTPSDLPVIGGLASRPSPRLQSTRRQRQQLTQRSNSYDQVIASAFSVPRPSSTSDADSVHAMDRTASHLRSESVDSSPSVRNDSNKISNQYESFDYQHPQKSPTDLNKDKKIDASHINNTSLAPKSPVLESPPPESPPPDLPAVSPPPSNISKHFTYNGVLVPASDLFSDTNQNSPNYKTSNQTGAMNSSDIMNNKTERVSSADSSKFDPATSATENCNSNEMPLAQDKNYTVREIKETRKVQEKPKILTEKPKILKEEYKDVSKFCDITSNRENVMNRLQSEHNSSDIPLNATHNVNLNKLDSDRSSSIGLVNSVLHNDSNFNNANEVNKQFTSYLAGRFSQSPESRIINSTAESECQMSFNNNEREKTEVFTDRLAQNRHDYKSESTGRALIEADTNIYGNLARNTDGYTDGYTNNKSFETRSKPTLTSNGDLPCSSKGASNMVSYNEFNFSNQQGVEKGEGFGDSLGSHQSSRSSSPGFSARAVQGRNAAELMQKYGGSDAKDVEYRPRATTTIHTSRLDFTPTRSRRTRELSTSPLPGELSCPPGDGVLNHWRDSSERAGSKSPMSFKVSQELPLQNSKYSNGESNSERSSMYNNTSQQYESQRPCTSSNIYESRINASQKISSELQLNDNLTRATAIRNRLDEMRKRLNLSNTNNNDNNTRGMNGSTDSSPRSSSRRELVDRLGRERDRRSNSVSTCGSREFSIQRSDEYRCLSPDIYQPRSPRFNESRPSRIYEPTSPRFNEPTSSRNYEPTSPRFNEPRSSRIYEPTSPRNSEPRSPGIIINHPSSPGIIVNQPTSPGIIVNQPSSPGIIVNELSGSTDCLNQPHFDFRRASSPSSTANFSNSKINQNENKTRTVSFSPDPIVYQSNPTNDLYNSSSKAPSRTEKFSRRSLDAGGSDVDAVRAKMFSMISAIPNHRARGSQVKVPVRVAGGRTQDEGTPVRVEIQGRHEGTPVRVEVVRSTQEPERSCESRARLSSVDRTWETYTEDSAPRKHVSVPASRGASPGKEISRGASPGSGINRGSSPGRELSRGTSPGKSDRNVTSIENGGGIVRDDVMEVTVQKSGLGLGFCIEGGKNSAGGDRPISVKRLFHGYRTPLTDSGTLRLHVGRGLPDGGSLRPGDEILAAEGYALSNLSHYTAWNFLKGLPDGPIILTIRRTS